MKNRDIIKKVSAILAMAVVTAVLLSLKACAKEPEHVENPIGIITMTTQAREVGFIMAGSKDITVDWGDGKKSNVNDAILDDISEWLYFYHDYSDMTEHNILITGDVTLLYCGGNDLTTLDVSQNTALVELHCNQNQLTALDVSNNAALERLECNSNQLKSLDVRNNIKLFLLSIVHNQLTASALNDLFRTLPDHSKKDNGAAIFIELRLNPAAGNPGNLDCDRSIAEERGWDFRTIR